MPIPASNFGMIRVLFLGESNRGSTSYHRFDALRRIGCDVTLIPVNDFVNLGGQLRRKCHVLTGFRYHQKTILQRLRERVSDQRFDIIWVDSGWWCGPKIAEYLKSVGTKLVLLNLDDPTGPREPLHWKSLIRSIPLFDLCLVVRPETQRDFIELGCKNTLHVWRCYDEVAHAPERADSIPQGELCSEVAFIGTRMENRHEFLIRLIELGVPLSIWGNGWQRGPGWRILKPFYRGSGLEGDAYVAAIKRAKINLGLLSKLNRDKHTTRSSEIPYAGGVVCMPKTNEHLSMFDDNSEAVLWDSPEECASRCHRLLNAPEELEKIRQNGRKRILALNLGNENLVAKSIASALNYCVEVSLPKLP